MSFCVISALTVITQDPSDNKILACALDGRADVIVSGDNHLLKLVKYKTIPILKPDDFLRNDEWKK